MKKPALHKSLALAFTGLLATASMSTVIAQAASDYEAMDHADEQWDFLNQHCTECHNFEDYSGGVDFTTMFVDEVPQNADVWEKAIQKLKL